MKLNGVEASVTGGANTTTSANRRSFFFVGTKHYFGAQALASSVLRAGKLTRERGTVTRRVVPPQQSLLGSGLLYLRRGTLPA